MAIACTKKKTRNDGKKSECILNDVDDNELLKSSGDGEKKRQKHMKQIVIHLNLVILCC